MTARVQSFEAFLENLRREVDKSKSVRRQLGVNGQHAHTVSRVRLSVEQVAAARKKFGPDVPLPEFLDQLSESVLKEINSNRKAPVSDANTDATGGSQK
jgi:hypothetical protein